jgi:hypothetical protein
LCPNNHYFVVIRPWADCWRLIAGLLVVKELIARLPGQTIPANSQKPRAAFSSYQLSSLSSSMSIALDAQKAAFSTRKLRGFIDVGECGRGCGE